MTVLVIVGAAAVAGAALVALGSARRRAEPLDTEREERWFVRHAPRRLQPVLHAADRRVVGGALVATSFMVVLIGAVLVGWLFDTIDTSQGFARWDRSAAQWGADHATDTSTDVLEALTNLGSTAPIWVVMAIAGLVARRRHGWGVMGYLAVVGIGVTALNNLLKAVIDRERPQVMPLTDPAGSSFPSGHSATAAACWAAIMLVLLAHRSASKRALGAVLAAAIATTVATTRVLLGVHWVSDVIAGVTVGWTWFALTTVVFGGRLLRFGEPAERVAADTEDPVVPHPDAPSVAPR